MLQDASIPPTYTRSSLWNVLFGNEKKSTCQMISLRYIVLVICRLGSVAIRSSCLGISCSGCELNFCWGIKARGGAGDFYIESFSLLNQKTSDLGTTVTMFFLDLSPDIFLGGNWSLPFSVNLLIYSNPSSWRDPRSKGAVEESETRLVGLWGSLVNMLLRLSLLFRRRWTWLKCNYKENRKLCDWKQGFIVPNFKL